MLEGIVKQYDVYLLIAFRQLLNAVAAVFVDSNRDMRELLLHLIGLITDFRHGGLCVCQHKAFALALVATTKDGHMEDVLKHVNQIFHMWRLASASYGDIAYGNNGNLERAGLQYPYFEQGVPKFHTYTVEPAKR